MGCTYYHDKALKIWTHHETHTVYRSEVCTRCGLTFSTEEVDTSKIVADVVQSLPRPPSTGGER